MKKKKIVIISLCSIIGLIFLDFIIAISFNNSPIIKIRDYYDGGVTVYKDKGIFTNTYKCFNGKTKTVLKTTKYVCPMNDIEKDIKEAITITFDTKGGSIIDSITIGKDTELTLPKDPMRDGYVFKGWVDKNETPIYNKALLAEDTTLYAVWEKDEISNTITITFDTKGGSKINSITINKDTELILPKDPTRDGYKFKSWVDKNETPIYNKALFTEDTILYAVWEKVENKKTNAKTEKPKTNTNTNNNNTNNNNSKDKTVQILEKLNWKYKNEELTKIASKMSVSEIKKNKSNLYGPFPNVGSAKRTVSMLNRLYPLRKCETLKKDYCLYYHLGECLGYCKNEVDLDKLKQMIDEITSFLNGDSTSILKKLNEKMLQASNAMNFEKALEYKNMIDDIKITLKNQTIVLNKDINLDIFNYYEHDSYLAIQVFFIRSGTLFERHQKIIEGIDKLENIIEYIINFYDKHILPKEILVPDTIDAKILEDYFHVKVRTPLKGDLKKLLDLAYENAKIYLETREKTLQEERSLLNIPDNFKKIIVVKDNMKSWYTEEGIMIIGIQEFLLNKNGLDL